MPTPPRRAMDDDMAAPSTVADILANAARQGRTAAPAWAPAGAAPVQVKAHGPSTQAQPPSLSETALAALLQKVADRACLDNEAASATAAGKVRATSTNSEHTAGRSEAVEADRTGPPLPPPARWRAGTTALLCCVAAVGGWLARGSALPLPAQAVAAASPPDRPSPVAEPLPVDATAPSPPVESVAAPLAGTTRLGFVTEPDIGGGAGLIYELSRRIEARSQVQVDGIASTGWAASLAALRTQPRVTVVRYDALQAARRTGAVPGMPALEIVAPLATEAVYFIVRADSALRFIHDIRGRRINVGPARSSSALTAETAYRQMFGAGPNPATISRLDDGEALESLHGHGALDVVVATGSTARAWLGALSSRQAQDFRLLELDPAHPAGRHVVRSFLRTRVGAESLGHFPANDSLTLSTLSFLVTARSAVPAGQRDMALKAMAGAMCSGPLTGSGLPPDAALGEPDVGWPYSTVDGAVLARCERPGTVPAKGERNPPTGS